MNDALQIVPGTPLYAAASGATSGATVSPTTARSGTAEEGQNSFAGMLQQAGTGQEASTPLPSLPSAAVAQRVLAAVPQPAFPGRGSASGIPSQVEVGSPAQGSPTVAAAPVAGSSDCASPSPRSSGPTELPSTPLQAGDAPALQGTLPAAGQLSLSPADAGGAATAPSLVATVQENVTGASAGSTLARSTDSSHAVKTYPPSADRSRFSDAVQRRSLGSDAGKQVVSTASVVGGGEQTIVETSSSSNAAIAAPGTQPPASAEVAATPAILTPAGTAETSRATPASIPSRTPPALGKATSSTDRNAWSPASRANGKLRVPNDLASAAPGSEEQAAAVAVPQFVTPADQISTTLATPLSLPSASTGYGAGNAGETAAPGAQARIEATGTAPAGQLPTQASTQPSALSAAAPRTRAKADSGSELATVENSPDKVAGSNPNLDAGSAAERPAVPGSHRNEALGAPAMAAGHGASATFAAAVEHSAASQLVPSPQTASAAAAATMARLDGGTDTLPVAPSGRTGALEVGFHDTTLGWLSVRASVDGSGDLHAAVAGRSPAVASAVSGMLPALNRFLQEQNVAVQSISSSAPMSAGIARDAVAQAGNAGAAGFSQAQAQAQGQAQHQAQQGNSGQAASDRQRRNDNPDRGSTWSVTPVRPDSAAASVNQLPLAQASRTSTVSVRI